MASGINLERLDVLVVDDNPHMRVLVRDILQSFGIRKITECTDGTEAFGELRNKPIDFAIVDWMMEPLDGIDFTRLIRTADDSPNPFLPIIMLTGHTERHRILQARDAGATEFLAKPVTPIGLFARIRALIDNPRQFVRVGNYFGPCRRRKIEEFGGIKRREGDTSTETEPEVTAPEAVHQFAEPTKDQEIGLNAAAETVKRL